LKTSYGNYWQLQAAVSFTKNNNIFQETSDCTLFLKISDQMPENGLKLSG
jgi:hypothetical protein